MDVCVCVSVCVSVRVTTVMNEHNGHANTSVSLSYRYGRYSNPSVEEPWPFPSLTADSSARAERSIVSLANKGVADLNYLAAEKEAF